jgi:hypothetical protein
MSLDFARWNADQSAMRTRFAATEIRPSELKAARLWWWRSAFLAARWRGC